MLPKRVISLTAISFALTLQALGQAKKLEGEAAAEMELALPSAQLNQPASYYRLQLTPKE